MIKLRLNFPMIFVLITAFLMMQSASAHIHLAEHHEHGDGAHEHQSEHHVHGLVDSHFDTADLSHQTTATSIIELDTSFNAPQVQKKLSDVVAILPVFQQIVCVSVVRNEHLSLLNNPQQYHEFSTTHPRAPPYFS